MRLRGDINNPRFGYVHPPFEQQEGSRKIMYRTKGARSSPRIAFKKGVKRQKAYGSHAPENAKPLVKSKPVYAIEKTNPRECYRCGEANFTMEH